MKKILGLLMILMVGSITQASDNRSAPNVFSSGSTISSSQMNENFNFLASNYRVKTIDCDTGETIASAIDAGYNFLTILLFVKILNSFELMKLFHQTGNLFLNRQ